MESGGVRLKNGFLKGVLKLGGALAHRVERIDNAQ